jgi:hypothetical protein
VEQIACKQSSTNRMITPRHYNDVNRLKSIANAGSFRMPLRQSAKSATPL